nr:MAG TPA: hypothetical protein [Caudoviricetes sp.]
MREKKIKFKFDYNTIILVIILPLTIVFGCLM